MGIIKMEYLELKKQRKDILVDIIYNNFSDLNDEPKLNHTPEAIEKTLNSKDVVLLLFIENGKIGGYLLAEVMILEDGRKVMYISYIFVAKDLRTSGVGTQLLQIISKIASDKYCDGIMLIYDTTQKKLRRFYDRNGFMLDFQLRRFEKHDVFYKII
jgi:ribosomal protein S18 acetylase RimI-like enzyme